MILYNLRYRGPYEYDKFILNTYQFCNEVLYIKQEIEVQDKDNNLAAINKKLKDMIDQLSETDIKLSYLYEEVNRI